MPFQRNTWRSVDAVFKETPGHPQVFLTHPSSGGQIGKPTWGAQKQGLSLVWQVLQLPILLGVESLFIS
ncbi:MAG: hypothetical protein HKL99_11725 [Burkholderiales bacterium]|nr:hypothetical protein [Burkholderiales bacterium]